VLLGLRLFGDPLDDFTNPERDPVDDDSPERDRRTIASAVRVAALRRLQLDHVSRERGGVRGRRGADETAALAAGLDLPGP
jgi:hypothetical protein